jgi:hypothetical protein
LIERRLKKNPRQKIQEKRNKRLLIERRLKKKEKPRGRKFKKKSGKDN